MLQTNNLFKKIISIVIGLSICCSLLSMLSISVNALNITDKNNLEYYELPQEIIDIINGSDDLIDYFDIWSTENDSKNDFTANEEDDSGSRWSGNGRQATHQYITACALAAFYSDMPNHVSFAYYGTTYWQIIMSASDLPDSDSWDSRNAYEGHFYNPYTGQSYTGSTSNTARANFANYYTSAVSYYKSGDYTTAYTFLGKALHYIQDLSEPHHSSNSIAVITNHTQFESYIDTNRTQFYLGSVSSTTYKNNYTITTGSLAQNAAVFSYAYASTVVNSNSTTVWDQVGQATVPKAIEYSACVLYNFAKDVGLI